jgi:hypothetical protein
MTQSTSSIEIYQFRVVLCETSPHIWRRILVASDTTLIVFHQVIQIAFGWTTRRIRMAGAAPGASRFVWRKKLPAEERGRYPRCIGGSGAPVPENCGGPIAFETFYDLFTPDYIMQRLTEMLDENWKPEYVAELHQLRPWMDRALARRGINARLQCQVGAGRKGSQS